MADELVAELKNLMTQLDSMDNMIILMSVIVFAYGMFLLLTRKKKNTGRK